MCKLQCLCPCRTSDGSSEYYAPLVKYVLRVRKKTMTPPLLENLPLPETLPPLEMMMTAGRQVPSHFWFELLSFLLFFQARINLRFFGNLGKVQSGHSDKKYAMARARG